MGTVQDVDRERRVAEVSHELATVARELAGHCLAVDLAVARGDFDVVCSSSEAARELLRRWALLYRELLALRTSPTRISEYSSL